MIALDVIPRVKNTIGACSEETVFEYLSDAVEILSNKGNWDRLTCYLDIPVTSGNEVVLPDFVADVLKVNNNRKPAFARAQVFGVRNNEVFLFSQPRPVRSVHRSEGWTPESIAEHAMPSLAKSFFPLDRSQDVFSWDPV